MSVFGGVILFCGKTLSMNRHRISSSPTSKSSTYNSYLVRLLSQVPRFFAPNIWCCLSRGSQDTTLSLLFLRSQMKDLKHCLTDVSLDEDFGTSRIRSVIPSCPCWTTLGFLSHYPKRQNGKTFTTP